MQKPPEKKTGEDGLPIPPYALYNIGGGTPENLMDFVQILSEELIRAKVLPADFDINQHMELVPMQADYSALRKTSIRRKENNDPRQGKRQSARGTQ